MNYKKIQTNGIDYLEAVEGTDKWYWGSDFCWGDLYEAEELFLSENTLKGNRLVLVSYPEGELVEPIPSKDGQYFGRPVFDDGEVMILLADFYEGQIKVISYNHVEKSLKEMVAIDRSEIKDCYNLLLRISPVYLSRGGQENRYEILWPEQANFAIEENESVFKREGDLLISSIWAEHPHYHEITVLRKYPHGDILDRISGTLMEMPDKQNWIVG